MSEMQMILCIKGFEQGGYVIGQGFGDDFEPILAVSTLSEVSAALTDITKVWDRQNKQRLQAQYEDENVVPIKRPKRRLFGLLGSEPEAEPVADEDRRPWRNVT